jgi:5-hydroxyisourate hydrolase
VARFSQIKLERLIAQVRGRQPPLYTAKGLGDHKGRQAMAAGKLTTHVLDTARGKPAAGVKIMLFRVTAAGHKKIAETVTNEDGRTDAPMLVGAAFNEGVYELVFSAGAYLRASGQATSEVLFLDDIPIRFGVPDADAHYHVPLLISPFAYSTYRGS